MGVSGLWKLLEPCGSQIPLETLEGKILAIDISIWLHQVVKGFQDNKGAALNNAHLLGLFHRVCKLLYYRIKPVFVFDGTVPELKKHTIARRQEQNSKLNNQANRLQALLLQSLAKEKLIRDALGSNSEELFPTSPKKKLCKLSKGSIDNHSYDNMFVLPPLSVNNQFTESKTESISDNEDSFNSDNCNSSTALDSSTGDENNAHKLYNTNLQAIDITSDEFRNLPPKLRHDILIDIKETRKQSSWGRLNELPSRSDEFSLFQMKRLLKRRHVQISLDEVEKEMGGHSLTYAELNDIFSENGILENTFMQNNSEKISCDDHTRFLLVKNLKKSQEHGEQIAEVKEEVAADNIKKLPQTLNYPDIDEKPTSKADQEYMNDLKLAIKLSLENKKSMEEEEYALKEDKKSNEKEDNTCVEHQHFKNAMKGPARSYMIEYGLYNDDEFPSLSNKTVTDTINSDSTFDINERIKKFNQPFTGVSTQTTSFLKNPDNLITENSNEIKAPYESTDSDTDSDFEEVPNCYSNDLKMEQDLSITIQCDEALNVCKKIAQNNLKESEIKNDDLFADIFNTESPQNLEILDNIALKCLENNCLNINSSSPKTIKTKECIERTENQNKIKLSTPPKHEHADEISFSINHQCNQENFTFPKPKYVNKCSPLTSKNYNSTTEILPENSIQSQTSNNPKSSESQSLYDNSFIKPIKEINTKNEAEALKEVALEVLNEQNSQVELLRLAANEGYLCDNLEINRNRRERECLTITEQMSLDCQYLLRIFGIPYISAPMEAEAQCAFLDMMKLTDGTITDDSDIWLFGGRTVYKNFFSQNKHVMEMKAHKIENLLHCNRQKLIQIACLVGSDYTTGISGIGVVTALEIIAQFSRFNEKRNLNNDSTKTQLDNTLNSLQEFRKWWESVNHKSKSVGFAGSSKSLRNKLRNIALPNNFPSIAVVDAYLNPVVDNDTEMFTWGEPDIPSILEFTRKTFGWSNNKTNDILQPVINSLHKKAIQSSIQKYFPTKSAANCKTLKTTKRIKKAIEMMTGVINPDNEKCIDNAKKRNTVECKKTIEPSTTSCQRNAVESVKTQLVNSSKLNDVVKITKYKKQSHQSSTCVPAELETASNESGDHVTKQVKRKPHNARNTRKSLT